MPTPVLSVVMPVYNCAAYLDDAVRSVLDQTFRAIESHSSRHRCVQARMDRDAPKARSMAAAALYEREAMRLWAGHRPRLLPELLARRLISPTPRFALILAWAALAFVSPDALRRAVRTMLRVRDRGSRARLGSRDVIDWRFG